jgi:predicted  nucleic acid-binding Zn-ribbon protein
MDHQHLLAFSKLTTNNHDLLRLAGTGVCTGCSKHIDSDSITTWVDDNSTAVCPHCGADALIPDCTATLVAALHDHWFATTV